MTVRAVIPTEVGMLGRVVAALGAAGGEVGGVDLVRSSRDATVRDITVYTSDESGAAALSAISSARINSAGNVSSSRLRSASLRTSSKSR